MSFFDRPKIFPPPQGRIKLQEFDNNNKQNANEHGIDGSGDYAVNKAAVLCFLCDYNYINTNDNFVETSSNFKKSNRLVAFKGFIEDFQIKLNTEYKDEGNFNTVVKSKYLENYSIGYSLSFNVIAHSVNDAVSNANRFSELERMITYPFATVNLGDSNYSINVPNAYVFLSNLINNGQLRQRTSFNITNAFVRKHGLRMAVEGIKMEPDLEMGVFEFNDKVYFKSFKITLEIPISNIPFLNSYLEERQYTDRMKTLIPYVLTSSSGDAGEIKFYDYKKRPAFQDSDIPEGLFDTKGFPFCFMSKPSVILTNYAQGVRDYGTNKRLKLGICINDSDISRDNNPHITQNYCVFDAFIDSFSYEKKQEMIKDGSWSDPVARSYRVGPAGEISFNLSLNIPSYSVIGGQANCMKINSLFRMVPISYYKQTLPGGPVKVLLNNLIKSPQFRNSNGNYDFKDIYDHGLACHIGAMNINIDNEMGFFEYNNFFIPKSMKLDLQLIIPHKIFGNIIVEDFDLENGSKGNYETYLPLDSKYWPML